MTPIRQAQGLDAFRQPSWTIFRQARTGVIAASNATTPIMVFIRWNITG
jgi:hypothetical protein